MSYPGYVYVPYPRWIQPADGTPRRIVQNSEEEEAATGVKMNPDGTVAESNDPPPDARPAPPTLETVIAAGYSPEVAASIVAEEQAKAAAGYPPYGTNKPTLPAAEIQPGFSEPQPEPTPETAAPAGDGW